MSEKKYATAEEILSITYKKISCPNAGLIELLPHISSHGLEVYLEHAQDPLQAFKKLYDVSCKSNGPPFEKLSNDDCDTIASMFAESAEFEPAYKESTKSSVADRFADAIMSSQLVLDYNRIRKSMFRQIKEQALIRRSHLSTVNSAIESATRTLGLIKPAFTPNTLASNVLRSTLTYQAHINGLLNSFNTFNDYSKSFNSALSNWAKIPNRGQFNRELGAMNSALSMYNSRLKDIGQIISSIPQIHTDLDDILIQAKSSYGISPRALDVANRVFGESKSVVISTNNFFASYPSIPATQHSDDLPDEFEDTFDDAVISVNSSELLLHNESCDLITLTNSLMTSFREVIKDELDNRFDEFKKNFGNLFSRWQQLSQPSKFPEMLGEFSLNVTRDHWRTMWRSPGDEWVSKPEQVAQSFLGLYLSGYWAGIAFVGREIRNGAGFVDLIVNFLGMDYIIELKIVGAGWSIGDAKAGLEQLNSYMGLYDKPEAYLLIFDGRKTATGEQLSSRYDLANGTAHVVNIPVYCEPPTKGR